MTISLNSKTNSWTWKKSQNKDSLLKKKEKTKQTKSAQNLYAFSFLTKSTFHVMRTKDEKPFQ